MASCTEYPAHQPQWEFCLSQVPASWRVNTPRSKFRKPGGRNSMDCLRDLEGAAAATSVSPPPSRRGKHSPCGEPFRGPGPLRQPTSGQDSYQHAGVLACLCLVPWLKHTFSISHSRKECFSCMRKLGPNCLVIEIGKTWGKQLARSVNVQTCRSHLGVSSEE